MANIGDEDELCGFDDDTDHWAGHRLMVLRKTRGDKNGWNQDVFAGMIGRDRSTISDWERGKTTIDHRLLFRIQKRLRMEIIPFVLYGEWRYLGDAETRKICDMLEKLPRPEPWVEPKAQERK